MSVLYGPAHTPTHRSRKGSGTSKQNWRETYYETPPSCSPSELFSSPSESEMSSINSSSSPGLRTRNSYDATSKSLARHAKIPGNEGSALDNDDDDDEEHVSIDNSKTATLLSGRFDGVSNCFVYTY